MITEEQGDLIRANWAKAVAVSDQTASVFYSHLFAMDPTTRPLFQADMEMQGRKLMSTLDFVIDNIDEPEGVLDAARVLARRHVSYGVTPEQYNSVGAALLAALGDLLGSEFTADDKEAWACFYGWLANDMIETAYAA